MTTPNLREAALLLPELDDDAQKLAKYRATLRAIANLFNRNGPDVDTAIAMATLAEGALYGGGLES